MPRFTQLDSARLARDAGLARARSLTVCAALGATGLTALAALIAANSIPGHAAVPAGQEAQAAAGADGSSGLTQPGLTVPAQPPQYAYGGAPVVVSGGS